MIIRQVCTYGKKIPQDEREMLLAFVLGKSREHILSHDTEQISLWSFFRYIVVVTQRAYGIPYAYLVHEAWFYGRRFFVNHHTLIPRPETEHIIEQALTYIHAHPVSLVVDIGTGSGCIPITLSKELNRPELPIIATDISRGALRVAKKNARTHNTAISFFQGHLIEPIESTLQNSITTNTTILITANLPYLTKEEFQAEVSIQHEPKSALIAKNQGLQLYIELIDSLIDLASRQVSIFLLLEMNDWQFPIMEMHLSKKKYDDAHLNTIRDLSDQRRILEITLPSVQE